MRYITDTCAGASWHLGYCSVPASLPANQVQENWHNVGVMQVLAGELRGSTEYVLTEALPKVMKLDGAGRPDELNFKIPIVWVRPGLYKKAYEIVKEKDKFFYTELTSTGRLVYYVLSQSQTRYKKISDTLVSKSVHCDTITN